MYDKERINEKNADILALCRQGNKGYGIINFVDTGILLKLHRFFSNFENIKQIKKKTLNEAKLILKEDLYRVYIHEPKIGELSKVVLKDFNKRVEVKNADKSIEQNEFKRDIIQARWYDGRRISKAKMKPDFPENYRHTQEALILHFENNYNIKLTTRDANDLLKTDFAGVLQKNYERFKNERFERIKENRKRNVTSSPKKKVFELPKRKQGSKGVYFDLKGLF